MVNGVIYHGIYRETSTRSLILYGSRISTHPAQRRRICALPCPSPCRFGNARQDKFSSRIWNQFFRAIIRTVGNNGGRAGCGAIDKKEGVTTVPMCSQRSQKTPQKGNYWHARRLNQHSHHPTGERWEVGDG